MLIAQNAGDAFKEKKEKNKTALSIKAENSAVFFTVIDTFMFIFCLSAKMSLMTNLTKLINFISNHISFPTNVSVVDHVTNDNNFLIV